MLKIFFVITTIILTLSATAVFLLFLKFSKTPLKRESSQIYSVITVKNSAETIEGIIRSVAWQMQNGNSVGSELIVIDLGSDDETFLILKKLGEEYPFIHPMHKTDYISHILSL